MTEIMPKVCTNVFSTPLEHSRTITHVIVVSWFLQCMGYVLRECGNLPCTVKTMRQLTCTDRPYKATARLASVPEYSTYCTLAVQCKVRTVII